MGNALLRFFCGCRDTADAEPPQPQALGPHGGVSASAVAALAHDLFNFQNTSQVPKELSKHVQSSKKDQANWYREILVAWKKAKQPPKSAEEAAQLVIETLKRIQKTDVEGFLDFYGLPLSDTLLELSAEAPTALPEGVKFEFQTLPVDAKAVQDGDSVTVYVSASDPRESLSVPQQVYLDTVERLKACSNNDYGKAKALHQKIISAGYRVLKIEDKEILARKYRIRLRGIDAPENKMPYGDEAKEELTNLVQGKCLRILVYGEDHYGRSVGDIYCNGIFVQEVLLKKGCAWHYVTYDKRPQFARWEREARAKRVGLWALPNPEKPWDWRKNNPRED